MKTDIEIAQETAMLPIKDVAASIGVEEDDLELYGKYKAKFSDEYLKKVQSNPNGKLVLVTAINPTPAGEGKTTTTVGLGEAFGQLGKKAVIALKMCIRDRPCRNREECPWSDVREDRCSNRSYLHRQRRYHECTCRNRRCQHCH